MQLIVDQFETFSGEVLQPGSTPLTDAEFLALCARYPDYRLETTAAGDILIRHPAHPRTGLLNAYITHELFAWARQHGRGEVSDSSAGFFLRNGARRSPASAWISRDRLQHLPNEAAMWHVTPDFVIELKSATDRADTLRAKMREWTANGVTLAWLILPETRTVEIYRADGSVDTLTAAANVSGEGPVAGFVLRLEPVWSGVPA